MSDKSGPTTRIRPDNFRIIVIAVAVFIISAYALMALYPNSNTNINVSSQKQNIKTEISNITILNPPNIEPNDSEVAGKISSFLEKPIEVNISK